MSKARSSMVAVWAERTAGGRGARRGDWRMGQLALSALLLACGVPPQVTTEPTVPSPSADTAVDTGRDPTEDTGEAPVAELEVIPGDGWVDVAPLDDVVATFVAPIDPQSVTLYSASIVDAFGRTIPHDLSIEQDDTVVVVHPKMPFPHGVAVTVEVTGLRWADGAVAPDVRTQFEIHPEQPFTEFLTGSSHDLFVYDDRLLLVSQTRFSDGLIYGTMVPSHDEQDRLTQELWYTEPGPDDIWFTADDHLNYVKTLSWSPTMVEAERRWSGPDHVVYTADDSLKFIRSTLDAEGRIIEELTSDAPGDDGAWFTSDDIGVYIVQNSRDRFGNVTRRSQAYAGADNLPLTPDDFATRCIITDHDPQGREIGIDTIDPGPDHRCFSGDDVSSVRELVVERDPRGLETLREITGDLVGVQVTEWDSRGLRTEYRRNLGPGPDGQIGTDDDDSRQGERFIYDDRGFLVRRELRWLPGPDGVLFTYDDEPGRVWVSAPPRAPGPRR